MSNTTELEKEIGQLLGQTTTSSTRRRLYVYIAESEDIKRFINALQALNIYRGDKPTDIMASIRVALALLYANRHAISVTEAYKTLWG